MKTFTDKYDQLWTLEFDLQKVKLIEAIEFPTQGKIIFFPPSENLMNLIAGTEICFGIIWALCQEQLAGKTYEKLGLDEHRDPIDEKHPLQNEEDFGRIFDGKAMNEAREALLGELSDFFPQMAATLSHSIAQYSRVTKLLDQKVAARMDGEFTDEKIDQMIEEAFTETTEEPLPKAMQKIMDNQEPIVAV